MRRADAGRTTLAPTSRSLELSLADGEVHVWWGVDIRAFGDGDLSPAERERASRFRRDVDRQRYVARRRVLRTLLGAYTKHHPADLRFETARYGRPRLARPSVNLLFNLSHSGDAAAIAVSRRVVGIDIERVRSDIDASSLAARICSSAERATLASLHPDDLVTAFFTCWAHKEAVCKADGRGLQLDPAIVDVTSAIHTGQAVTTVPGEKMCAARWCSSSIALIPGIAAAIAVDECGAKLTVRRIDSVLPG